MSHMFAAAREIRDAHRAAIMALPDVVGSGIGQGSNGEAVIRIYLLTENAEPAYRVLIRHIDGVPVEWEVTGELTALAESRR